MHSIAARSSWRRRSPALDHRERLIERDLEDLGPTLANIWSVARRIVSLYEISAFPHHSEKVPLIKLDDVAGRDDVLTDRFGLGRRF